MTIFVVLALALFPGLEADYRAAEARLAKAKRLEVYVHDNLSGTDTLMQFEKPDKYRVQSSDGTGSASNGKQTFRRLNSFGWYEDFKSEEQIPEDVRPAGFNSFFDGRADIGEILDGDPHPANGSEPYFQIKASESGIFYATFHWSRKRMLPCGFDAWEKDVHADDTTYTSVKLDPKFDAGTFSPK